MVRIPVNWLVSVLLAAIACTGCADDSGPVASQMQARPSASTAVEDVGEPVDAGDEPSPEVDIAPADAASTDDPSSLRIPVTELERGPLSYRSGAVTAWTGTELLVVGGGWLTYTNDRGEAEGMEGDTGRLIDDQSFSDGARYDPATETWRSMAALPNPIDIVTASVWTGERLVVVGEYHDGRAMDLLIYDPATDAWSAAGIEAERSGYGGLAAVSAGDDVLLWGYPYHQPDERPLALRIDVGTGTTAETDPGPLGFRELPGSVWTGSEMIVFGGDGVGTIRSSPGSGDGAAYDPATDTWRPLAVSPFPTIRDPRLTWTGTEVVVWGGSSGPSNPSLTAAYDPAADTWRELEPSPIAGLDGAVTAMVGDHLYVFGGLPTYAPAGFPAAARLDVTLGTWELLDLSPRPTGCAESVAVAGREVFLFGGRPGCQDVVDADTGFWQVSIPG